VTGIARETITRLARDFMSARAPLALGGGPACSHTNATVSLIAINGLNAMAGKRGREIVRGQFSRKTSNRKRGQYRASWLTEQAVIELIQQEKSTSPALILYDSNPLFGMPPSVPIHTLFDRAPFIVSFSQFLDESTAQADLVLPDRAALESWADHVIEAPVPAVGLSQPVVTPLHDTQQVGDTILQLGRRLGLRGQTWHGRTFYDVLRERWRTFLDRKSHHRQADWFDQAWATHLQQGGWWPASSRRLHPLRFAPSLRFEPATLTGDEQDFPFILYPYPSVTIGYGEGANRPWLQELPDTMTSVVWGSWAELNPETANRLGVRQGDLVRVTSPFGSFVVPVVIFPAIRPDVVAMPIGQGHTSYGRYAKGRGANPLALLAPAVDAITGTSAAGGTRVRIESAGGRGRLITLERPAMEASDLITIERRVTSAT
jgi:anaerobic selenocysteine-containing dehydrogenase